MNPLIAAFVEKADILEHAAAPKRRTERPMHELGVKGISLQTPT